MDRLDLDALVEESGVIVSWLQEPSVEEMLNLMKLANLTKEDDSYVEKLIDAVIALIPELSGQRLTMKKLNAIVQLLMEMIQSQEQKDLNEKGVEATNPKVEAAS